MNRRKNFSCTRTGAACFTLTEILVVTALLLILTGLFLPGASNVVFRTREVACLSNMRNLGTAFALYTQDNRHYLPHEDTGTSAPPHDQCWYDVLDKYIRTSPTHSVKQDPRYEQLHSDDPSQLGHSIKMNSRLENYKGTKSYTSGPFRKVTTISARAETVLVFDGRCDSSYYRSRPYGMHTSVEARHLGKGNMLFTDFHAEAMEGPLDAEMHWNNSGGLYWDPDADLVSQ